MADPQKKQLLADITVAAKSQGWSKVEVQGLIILTKPILAKLLVVFRNAHAKERAAAD